MRVLIIGGTGNISTAMTKYFLEKEHEVTLYNRGNAKIEGTRCICGDRTKHAAFEEQMKKEKFDCVIDMIGYHPDDAKSLVRAFHGRTEQIIFCSTVDVYTKPAKRYPIIESDERKPSSSFEYAYNKAICENILMEANTHGEFPLTIIRPAATYNDNWCPISLIGSGPALLKRIREGMPVIVLGDGTSFWTSSHRDDVARAFVGAAENKKTLGKAYNVTGDEFMTWEEYYSTAARVMKAPPIDFVHIPTDLLSSMAPKSAEWSALNFKYNNIFDNSAAKEELGYRYTISWEEGVRRVIEYHDSHGYIDSAEQSRLYNMIVEKFREAEQKLIKEYKYE